MGGRIVPVRYDVHGRRARERDGLTREPVEVPSLGDVIEASLRFFPGSVNVRRDDVDEAGVDPGEPLVLFLRGGGARAGAGAAAAETRLFHSRLHLTHDDGAVVDLLAVHDLGWVGGGGGYEY